MSHCVNVVVDRALDYGPGCNAVVLRALDYGPVCKMQ